MKINKNFSNLIDSYLFSTIENKTKEFISKNPDKKVIKLGVGDATLPLCPVAVKAMQDALFEMSKKESFRGYGPEQGYTFLRENIKNYYKSKNVDLSIDEIFVNDGAQTDLGNILDLFTSENKVLIPDPVYPAYVDTNVMDGREISYVNALEENNFLPLPDENVKADIIYMCSPNNPTGAVYNYEQLKKWVDYAIKNDSIILFDSAYEIFITDENLPSSIFEIEGAKKCAIEFCSLSKTAGFTGTRCGYTVIPKELVFEGKSINSMWLRRLASKCNGVSYITQKGAAAVFTEEGISQTRKNISYYKENAKLISNALKDLGLFYTGGENSPYVWFKCPNNMDSWEFFDYLLNEANVVGTPGSGFGKNGEGFFRLSGFGSKEETFEAVQRLRKLKF